MAAVKVLQVVGFKNSGKTTLILKLLRWAKAKGKIVSTIKHHGHESTLDTPSAETDSMRFFERGADSSLVYGNGVVQLHVKNDEINLEELIGMSLQPHPDIVLVEGFKNAGYEKIIFIRSDDDWMQLGNLSHVAFIALHEGVQLDSTQAIENGHEKELKKWFFEWMESEPDESV